MTARLSLRRPFGRSGRTARRCRRLLRAPREAGSSPSSDRTARARHAAPRPRRTAPRRWPHPARWPAPSLARSTRAGTRHRLLAAGPSGPLAADRARDRGARPLPVRRSDPARLGEADSVAVHPPSPASRRARLRERDVLTLSRRRAGARHAGARARGRGGAPPAGRRADCRARPRHQILVMQAWRRGRPWRLVIAATHDLGLAARHADLVLALKTAGWRLLAPARGASTRFLRDAYGVEACSRIMRPALAAAMEPGVRRRALAAAFSLHRRRGAVGGAGAQRDLAQPLHGQLLVAMARGRRILGVSPYGPTAGLRSSPALRRRHFLRPDLVVAGPQGPSRHAGDDPAARPQDRDLRHRRAASRRRGRNCCAWETFWASGAAPRRWRHRSMRLVSAARSRRAASASHPPYSRRAGSRGRTDRRRDPARGRPDERRRRGRPAPWRLPGLEALVRLRPDALLLTVGGAGGGGSGRGAASSSGAFAALSGGAAAAPAGRARDRRGPGLIAAIDPSRPRLLLSAFCVDQAPMGLMRAFEPLLELGGASQGLMSSCWRLRPWPRRPWRHGSRRWS